MENTQFRPNSANVGYVFEGRLTVTIVDGGVKKSEFYYFNVGLDKTSEEERNGTTIQFLEATSGLGTFSFIPGIVFCSRSEQYRTKSNKDTNDDPVS